MLGRFERHWYILHALPHVSTRVSLSFALATGLFVFLTPLDTRAQGVGERAAARTLFTSARELARAGKYEEACPKFEESLRLDYGSGTAFNLADCWEQLGRTASAWTLFLEVAAAEKSAGHADREGLARARAAALEPRLSRLVIEVAHPTPGLEIRRDGVLFGSGSWNTPVATDPGEHVITASAAGHEPWSGRVELTRETPTTTVSVPRLAPKKVVLEAPSAAATASPSPPPANAAPAVRQSPTQDEAPDAATDGATGAGTGQTLALVAGGVGVLGVVGGTLFALRVKSKNDSAKELCPGNRCGSAEIERHDDLLDEARSARTWAFVSFGVGGVALAAAAVLYASAGPDERTAPTTGLRVAPLFGASWGLGAATSF